MKKSIIAMAVAGAMTVPAIASADATLYGNADALVIARDGKTLSIDDASSEVGVKGDVDLGLGNTKGFFKLEWDISINDGAGTGDGYMGLKGDWGKLTLGDVCFSTDDSPTAGVGLVNDPKSTAGGVNDCPKHGVTYDTASMSGLAFSLGAGMNGTASKDAVTDEEGNTTAGDNAQIDMFGVGLTYSAGAFSAKAAHTVNDEDGSTQTDGGKTVLTLGYSSDMLDLAAYTHMVDVDGVDSTGFGLGSKFKFGNDLSFGVAYTTYEMDGSNAKPATVQVELAKGLNGRGGMSVGVINENEDATGGDSASHAYLGYRLSF